MVFSLTPPYRDLTFLSPLSEQRAERLVRFVAQELRGTVVDIGCGWAEPPAGGRGSTRRARHRDGSRRGVDRARQGVGRAAWSGRLDELVSLGDLVDLAAAHRFLPVAVHEANLDEWDEFESGYGAWYASWLVEHGRDHPDVDEVLALAARQHAGYFHGYRGIMGMAYLALVAV